MYQTRKPMSHSIKSPVATSFAVSLAVCLYNSGLEQTLAGLLKSSGLKFDTFLQRQWRSMDKERMRKGDYAVRDTWKEKCKLKKRSEIKENNMPSKNQKVFSVNHKDFILILRTYSFSLYLNIPVDTRG